MNEIITSLQNPQVKIWRSLNKSKSQRLQHGLFLAEGEHMAQEAVKETKCRALLVDVNAQDKYAPLIKAAQGASLFLLSSHVMEAVCDAKTPQGIVAVCDYPDISSISGNLLVALDGVQDPGNIGTILRTMDAAGFHGLLIDEKTADPCSPKALRASMGSIFRLPCQRIANLPGALSALAQDGYQIIAGDLKGTPFFERPSVGQKVCIIIGNEGAGISPAVLQCATLRLKLPMLGGAESLNAAVAGAIMMYDILREHAK